ncbi:MAG: hypothetical protein KGJ86_08105 [Chloroflexota bacterium]|nr:hypothetical protein [Chloroflexota bacterium]
MRRLTESVFAVALVAVALTFAAVGVAANVAGFSEPDTWFLTGLGFAVMAVAAAIDEQRLTNLPVRHAVEQWFGRAFFVLAGILEVVGFILGLMGDETRNLWSVMGIVLALVGVSAALDSHRLAIARHTGVSHELTDAIGGMASAAAAFGIGIFGFFTGLFGLPHSEAWLFGAVVFAVVAVAFMLDEQLLVAHRARQRSHVPFKSR